MPGQSKDNFPPIKKGKMRAFKRPSRAVISKRPSMAVRRKPAQYTRHSNKMTPTCKWSTLQRFFLSTSPMAIIIKLRHMGLLPRCKKCPTCGCKVPAIRRDLHYQGRCVGKSCHKQVGNLTGHPIFTCGHGSLHLEPPGRCGIGFVGWHYMQLGAHGTMNFLSALCSFHMLHSSSQQSCDHFISSHCWYDDGLHHSNM